MIQFLWKNREKPSLLSKRWLVVWIKRLVKCPPLIKIFFNRAYYSINGVELGDLSIISKIEINGPHRNLSIGNSTFIGINVHIATHELVKIGSYACVNDNVRILSASHDISDPLWSMCAKSICIKDYAWIATGAIILPGVTIGRGAVIGAGAVVAQDIPDYSIAIGNPAKIRLNKRPAELTYDPVLFSAPYEAWVGPGASTKEK